MAHSKAKKVIVCREAVALQEAGEKLVSIARRLSVPAGTLERWLRLWKAGGPDALEADYSKVGRKAVAECIPEKFRDFIRRKVAMCGSAVFAYRMCIDDPACPDELREYLIPKMMGEKPPSLALSLRRAVVVTPDLAAKYRSDVAYDHVSFKLRHDPIVLDPFTGQWRPLMAGDLFLSDDMSINHYFWAEITDADAKTRGDRDRKLAEKHGVFIGRQGLYTNDARGKWLGFDLIGRPSDAYTAADVLRHFRRIIAMWGMPRIGWILEKGVWMARTINGMKVIIGDGARQELVLGLSSMGFEVIHVHSSEGKALIEGAFGYLQRALDVQEAPTIGHKRGEMERVEKLVNRCHEGVVHPKEVGIAYISDMADIVNRAMTFCNANPKYGRIQNGIPDEVWSRDTTAHPLRKMKPEHMGVFMPTKFETMIRQGHVDKTLDGVNYRFFNEIFGRLCAGYRLEVAFDPGEPTAGAEIYNLETGARNFLGLSPKAWICHAELENNAPLCGYSAEVEESTRRRKASKRAFAAEFRSTGLWGKGCGKASERRTADGTLVRMETNLGDGGGTAAAGSRAPAAEEAAIPTVLRARKAMTPEQVDAAAAEADALEARLRERGQLLPY